MSGAAPGKRSGSKHRATSCLTRNDVALPSRVIADLERGATECWSGKCATDCNHFRLARDLVEPSGNQAEFVSNVSRWRADDRLRVLLRDVDGKPDCVA